MPATMEAPTPAVITGTVSTIHHVERKQTPEEDLWVRMRERGLEPQKPLEWAKQICLGLEAAYTGKDKIDLVKDAMVDWHNGLHLRGEEKRRFLKLEKTDPARHLTAEQAIQVLRQGHANGFVPSMETIRKAEELRTKGTIYFVQMPGHEADSLTIPDAPAPERDLEEITSPALETIDIGGEVQTVGPRAVVPQGPKAAVADSLPEPPHKRGGGARTVAGGAKAAPLNIPGLPTMSGAPLG